jgi:hypothetical protein
MQLRQFENLWLESSRVHLNYHRRKALAQSILFEGDGDLSAGIRHAGGNTRLAHDYRLLLFGCQRLRGSLRSVTFGFETPRSPIERGKSDAPEFCRWLDKFHPDFRDARFADGTEIHHAASELLLRHYVPDRQQFSHGDSCAEQYQCAVCIYDDGFGVLWR